MVDIRHFPTLTIRERALLNAAGAVIARLEAEHPCQVAFVSSDPYFVAFQDIAQVLRELGNAGMRAASGS